MKRISELNKEEQQRALDLHRKTIVIDTLNNIHYLDSVFGKWSWGGREERIWRARKEDIKPLFFKRLAEGGYTAIVTTAVFRDCLFEEALKRVYYHRQFIEENSDKIFLATTIEDIESAKKEGKVAIVFGFQNPKPMIPLVEVRPLSEVVQDAGSAVAIFYSLGVRITQLTYNYRNLIAEGCNERTNCGLSKFGVRFVEKLNELGMVIDLSHAGPATVMDAIEYSKDPVICSHTNVYSLCENIRNIQDEGIKALAEKGGVIGISGWSYHLVPPPTRATIEDVLDHIEYLVNLVGVDHVGYGSDAAEFMPVERFEGLEIENPELMFSGQKFEETLAEGLDTISKLPNLTKGLVARGYSDQEISKILGGNWLRVFKRVWK